MKMGGCIRGMSAGLMRYYNLIFVCYQRKEGALIRMDFSTSLGGSKVCAIV